MASRPNPFMTLIKLIGAIVLTGVIAAGFFLPYVAGLGMTARWGADKFLDTKCDLVESPVAQKTTIYASDGTTEIAQLFEQNRTVVPLSQIPAVVQQALVGTEDRRFYEHHGVDLQGLVRAAWETGGNSNQQGASTLTEQYVKQVRYYQAKTPEERAEAIDDNVDRKIYEAACAIDLEKTNTKQQILEKYLNIAFFGQNAYGIESAAQTFFNVSASQLTLPQAALLVGLVQSPTQYNPFNNPDAAKARRDVVLDNMVRSKYISQADADAAKATPIQLSGQQEVARGCAYANPAVANVGFFCDYAYNFLIDPARGNVSADALQTGGWKVVTTLDPNLQNMTQASVSGELAADSASAIVMPVIDPTTGSVTTFATSRKYGVVAGDPGYTTDPLFTDAYSGTGSTYKYFTLLAALKAGADQTLTLTTGNTYTPKHCVQKGAALVPMHNATENYAATMNLRSATIQSSNTYFVGVEDQVFGCQLAPIVDMAKALGVNSLNAQDPNSNGLTYGDAIVAGTQYTYTLGQQATSALEMASAYGAVANDGMYCPPNPIASISDAAGQPVAFTKPKCAQVVDPLVARSAVDILIGDTKAGERGTATGAFGTYYGRGGSPIAGKTGTNNDTTDQCNAALWFVGVTPRLTAATALVNPTNPGTPMLDIPGHAGSCSTVWGATSAQIWSNALSDYLLKQQWTWPSKDATPNLANVPFVTGQTPQAAAQKLKEAGFTMVQAADPCKGATRGTVAWSTPKRQLPGGNVMVCLSDGSAAPPPAPSAPSAPPAPANTPAPADTPNAPAPNPSISVNPQPGNNGNGNGGGGNGGGGRGNGD